MKLYLKKYYHVMTSFLAFVGVCMLFLPCGIFARGEIYSIQLSGWQLLFGYSGENYTLLKFNILGFLSILFILCGVILSFLSKKMGKYTSYISSALLLIGAIFYILIGSTIKVAQESIAKDFVTLFPLYLGFAFLLISSILLAIEKWLTKSK